ncbi:hypothetical protein OX284_007495 [Flavobacterium sp. SUN046]|uniref:hypothetical protein n=1 Tax=Flavobacterium sp. SUN046 TaxID=3002440 RepID=UPI002DB8AE9A|nr:hypothetical protein [Flavobacterium sp. SUN046]MEC4049270.1 hypothetical protein [Flavobacterium sp. SUN046]
MENIFYKIGYTIAPLNGTNSKATANFLSINNPDGTPRWIWNAKCNTPLFLKFYNVGSKRALIFASLIKLVFVFKLQKLVFKKHSFLITTSGNPIIDIHSDWALFTGTVGPNNKAILYANKSFFKIATTPNAEKLINGEHEILEKINTVSHSFIIPKTTKLSDAVIQLTDISNDGQRLKSIEEAHLKALLEMSTIDKQTIKVADWKLFNDLKADFRSIADERIPKNTIRKINTILDAITADEVVDIALSQGDFTQWNMYEKNGQLSIYDWELASADKSKAFDYFHFIIQNGILVDRKNWKAIYADILNGNRGQFAKDVFNADTNELHNYLKWYLLINCMHYLKVYADQKEWHIQIDWLLNVWAEALNPFVNQQFSARQLLIMDFFDAIQNKQYAGLKLLNEAPEALSLNSDIDIVIDKSLNQFITDFLKNHALVMRTTDTHRSFMNSILAFTNDGNILSVDLIWQLKRRNLEILEASSVIAANYTNSFGVKTASEIDTARYVVLFYVLNSAKIPEKYLNYEQAILESTAPMDVIIKEYFKDSKKDKSILLNYIKNNSNNKGIQHIKNTINYSLDTMKNSKKSNGFVVTFSGVDGAGKSTIIENISKIIEKQLRKPVVVIRHRPSILPILSVWSKGKEKAHQDTISSLPRQGNNKSFISSLIRFAYYYSDYFFGQFVIYFKYTLRGTVVIYDRYYFDFINDSKRSNIVLPKNITRMGYKFLLKPKFNFFLYADADVILKRKQELNKETIESLTQDYTQLFAYLQSKDKSSVYLPINNIDLETTLDLILNTVKQA